MAKIRLLQMDFLHCFASGGAATDEGACIAAIGMVDAGLADKDGLHARPG